MTNDKHSLSELKTSLRTLWHEFGQTDSLTLGIIINTSMVAIGVAGVLLLDGLLQFIACAWLVLNLYPLVEWVVRY